MDDIEKGKKKKKVKAWERGMWGAGDCPADGQQALFKLKNYQLWSAEMTCLTQQVHVFPTDMADAFTYKYAHTARLLNCQLFYVD